MHMNSTRYVGGATPGSSVQLRGSPRLTRASTVFLPLLWCFWEEGGAGGLVLAKATTSRPPLSYFQHEGAQRQWLQLTAARTTQSKPTEQLMRLLLMRRRRAA